MNTTLKIVGRILRKRLQQSDLKEMLGSLGDTGRETLIEQMSDILSKAAVFFEISQKLNDSLSLDTVLQRVMEVTNEAMNTERSTIFLHDRDTSELFSRVAIGELAHEIRIPRAAGIAGSVFMSGEAIIIDDAYSDSRFNRDVDLQTGFHTRNILCAPVRSRAGESIGVIQLLNKRSGDFTRDDLNLLESITAMSATALQNVLLFEEVRRIREEESRLLEVTTAISTELHLEPLLFKIMQATTEILDADRSTLFMHDREHDELWSLVAQGTGSAEIRLPSSRGIAGSVFTTGETINIEDAYEDSRFNPEVDRKTGYRTHSILCMPVVNKEGVRMGAIQVLNKRGGPFTNLDEKRLRAFSAQASIAIENAKLFDQVLNIKNYNESILESMSNGVLTLGANGRVVKCNAALTRIMGEMSVDILGKSADEVFNGPNGWVAESAFHAMETVTPEISMDTEIFLSDGRGASVNLNAVPLKSIKGEMIGSMLVFEDITNEKRLKGTMARYMTKEVADRLLEEGSESVLGGQLREATVLFSDIRNFTTISEKLGPRKTVSMLNSYFTGMVDIIFHHGGILDKYIGDALLAVFGTPFSSGMDADKAVQAAVDMVRTLGDFNASSEFTCELGAPLSIGIGISTDEILVGNIGSLKRMDYTVIGDGVNLASRLEGANKYFGTNILVGERTWQQLKGDFLCRQIDRIQVKGKTMPVGVYEVLDYHDSKTFPGVSEVIELYGQGMSRYHQRDFAAGADFFRKALEIHPGDTASEIYLERCSHFAGSAPPSDWDGTWVMKDK
ncbi:MAG: adenylate/guanylate cyclase domain-containing protein [Candidatus Wallbacteria bacterium HGW-Wallbacteria-1]|jgi:adenylate cyclase|uniref:Adenylate/guanylate cyclase domain-containing protein n=1 Tax=Candidatus Wallbacteria bacterium HGW-Wallbacteria-1 TaxID=2013854 RepID=A0A2N1PJQ3_9BACT|nr:MAG: adenylate/guanylate cyclase domain-containing protein [Candidatus Wallbacteria bacterium HGW-Wallbacteria-1]